jgi:hypothetical protein
MAIEGGIFLTIKDLMKLTGCKRYETARKEHQYIRQFKNTAKNTAVRLPKHKITIHEYCKYKSINFIEVWQFLRAGQWHPLAEQNNKKAM